MRRIGIGGMGEVYLALERTPAGPKVCVVKKVLPHLTAQSQFVRRFLDEARVALRLRHPNIARVHAMGEVAGEYFLAMEYVQGKTLSRLGQRLRERGTPLPVGLVLHLGEQVCAGLSHAHASTDEAGVPLQLVHRDLSPANVCVSYGGEVKIIDFGAAHSTLKEAQTAPRTVIGNLAYMAPEQARKRWVDARADVYSLGAVLWELLVHRALAQDGDVLERWRRAVQPRWEPPSQLRAGVPPAVDAVLLRALSLQPEDRHPDATAFGEALGQLRERLFPEAGEQALSALLSDAFAREKAAEEAVLAQLLEPRRPRPARRRPAPATPASAPPVPEALVPPTALAFEHPASTEPELQAVPGPPAASPRRSTTEVFGAVLEGAEARLVREIQGGADETPSLALEEPTTTAFDTLGGSRTAWLAAGVFLGAALAGLVGAMLWAR